MKLFANGTSNDKDFAILKDNEKFNKDLDSEDVVASNATKMTYKDGKVTSYVVPIDASETKEEEQASRCLRHLWLYERRMDRGLFCALGFIIILCLVGMATSIGGALYLKFRSHGNSTPMSLIVPVSAGLAGDENLIDSTKASMMEDGLEDLSRFRIRVNISLPAMDSGSSDLIDSETTMDPFEETMWEEIRRRNELGDATISGSDVTKVDSDNKVEVSTDSLKASDGVEFSPSVAVNKHRALQEPPSFSDFLTFIRKSLRIPTIKIIRDHDTR